MEHYLKLCFEELSHQDGLLVLGKGLGINLLFTKFVQYFSLRGTGRTVFCINANGYEKAIINLLIAEQCPPEQLPKVCMDCCCKLLILIL